MSLLTLKDVQKTYRVDKGVEQRVLKGITLSFERGEFVSILGESGCGKSTLMNIIGGMDSHYEGDVFVNGQTLKGMKGRALDDYRKANIGFIFQSFNLIPHLSVLDNVTLAMEMMSMTKSERIERATDLLIQVGLKDHLHKRPNQLSGGQKQRVSIARALANDPDIILADEPTGALDRETTLQILELLREIAQQGKLILAVTHSSKVASFGTRVVSLEDGLVIKDEQNPASEVEVLEVDSFVPRFKAKSLTYASCAKLAIRNMKINWKRNALVSFGSAIGISSLMLMLSMGSGVESYLMDTILATLNPKTVSISKEQTMPDLMDSSAMAQSSSMAMMQEQTPFTAEDLEQIQALDLVTEVEPVVTFMMSSSLTDGMTGNRADLMMLTSMEQTVTEDYLAAGHLPQVGDNEVLITTMTALTLFGTDDYESMIGQPVTFTLQLMNENNVPTLLQADYRIAGIYELDNPMVSSMPVAFLTYEDLATLHETYGFTLAPTQLNVMAESEDQTNELKEALFDLGYADSQTNQMLEMMLQMLDIMTALFLGISGISLVVSGVMILVVLYISVVERTREIGVLRAIGARQKDVKRIFIVESIGLGLLAGAVATAVAMLCKFVGNHLMTDAFGVGIIDLTTTYIAMGILVSLVVSVVAGWFPARQAAKLDPVESLRYE